MPKIPVYRVSYEAIISHRKITQKINNSSKVFCPTSSIGVAWYIPSRNLKRITVKARRGCGGEHYLYVLREKLLYKAETQTLCHPEG